MAKNKRPRNQAFVFGLQTFFGPCVIEHSLALKSVAFGKGINNRFGSHGGNHSFD